MLKYILVFLLSFYCLNIVYNQATEKQLKANACGKLIRARVEQDNVK